MKGMRAESRLEVGALTLGCGVWGVEVVEPKDTHTDKLWHTLAQTRTHIRTHIHKNTRFTSQKHTKPRTGKHPWRRRQEGKPRVHKIHPLPHHARR